MTRPFGADDLIAARKAAKQASDAYDDPKVLFASVGCVWEDAAAVARQSSMTMIEMLYEEVGIPYEEREPGGPKLPECVEDAWLGGLLVGLFLEEPFIERVLDADSLARAQDELREDEHSIPMKLGILGLNPEATQDVAVKTGAAENKCPFQNGGDGIDWIFALATVWLDGLLVATAARNQREQAGPSFLYTLSEDQPISKK